MKCSRLRSQMRRAAASIGADNIAEGCGKDSRPNFARFLQNAAGSASEVEYHLLLARDLGYLPSDAYERLAGYTGEIRRMFNWIYTDAGERGLRPE